MIIKVSDHAIERYRKRVRADEYRRTRCAKQIREIIQGAIFSNVKNIERLAEKLSDEKTEFSVLIQLSGFDYDFGVYYVSFARNRRNPREYVLKTIYPKKL